MNYPNIPCCAWVFDLDNTLHDATSHIFPHISRSMTNYLHAELGMELDEASRLRVYYWKKYGATLLGLMRHHDINPRHFLWHTHQFPALDSMVLSEPALQSTLRHLPGRKFIFSNSPIHYSSAVLKVLKIGHVFDDVFTIEHTRFRPKPDCYGFLRLFRKHGLNPRQCIMVEDSLDNLKVAKKLGMKTVWITRSWKNPTFVDIKARSLSELRRRASNHLISFW